MKVENNDGTFLQTIGRGSLSCATLRSHFLEHDYLTDPNNGTIYSRELVYDPKFLISVHTKKYDPTRWNTLYMVGKYYEYSVFQRFLYILTAKKNGAGDLSQQQHLVLDVGANIGYYTLVSLALGAHVISFEVNPANLLRLCESLDLNRNTTTIIENNNAIFLNGVWSEHGVVKQVAIPENPGQAVLIPFFDKKRKLLNTTTVTLDKFAEERGWFEGGSDGNSSNSNSSVYITLLKIDIEGKEPWTIIGATRLLGRGMIQNILVEMRRLKRALALDAVNLLLASGYGVVVTKKDKHKRLDVEESRTYLDKLRNKIGSRSEDVWFRLQPI